MVDAPFVYIHLFFPGGGANKGIPPDPVPGRTDGAPCPDPSAVPLPPPPAASDRLAPRPGILTLNVCPSLSEKSCTGAGGLVGSASFSFDDPVGLLRCFEYDWRATLKSNLDGKALYLERLFLRLGRRNGHERDKTHVDILTHHLVLQNPSQYMLFYLHRLQLGGQSTVMNPERVPPNCCPGNNCTWRTVHLDMCL